CAHEAHSPARPFPAAGLERRQGRSAADSNRAKPQAARQTSLPCPATLNGGLPCVAIALSVDGVNRRHTGSATNQPPKLKIKPCNRDPKSFATQSGAERKWPDRCRNDANDPSET